MNKRNVLLPLIILLLITFYLAAQDRYLKFEMQYVTVNDFNADGFILAIGGGGEGTIGRVKGKQVIASQGTTSKSKGHSERLDYVVR